MSGAILISLLSILLFPSMKKRQSPALMSGALPETPSAMAAALHHRGDCQKPRNESDLLWIQLATALSLLNLVKTFTFGSALEKGGRVAVNNLLSRGFCSSDTIDVFSRLAVLLIH